LAGRQRWTPRPRYFFLEVEAFFEVLRRTLMPSSRASFNPIATVTGIRSDNTRTMPPRRFPPLKFP